jgi:hypothetical protein
LAFGMGRLGCGPALVMLSLVGRILVLSVVLMFVFNGLLYLAMALVGWHPSWLELSLLFGLLHPDVWHKIAQDDPTITSWYWAWWFILWVLGLVQSCLLLLPLPVSVDSGTSARLVPRALAAALLAGSALAIPLLALADVVYFVTTDQPGVQTAKAAWAFFCVVALLAWLLSWLIWPPILLHRSRGQADAIERFVGKNIAGSAVGLALTLPWYFVVRRKFACYCTQGSFWALVLGLWSLLLIGGPLLFVLARDRRIRAGVRAG